LCVERVNYRPDMPAAKLLTTAQAAAELGISRRTLARYVEQGVAAPALTLPSGHHRWDLEDLQRQLRDLRKRSE
jgi:DNA-binding transcriptional MerR regulator